MALEDYSNEEILQHLINNITALEENDAILKAQNIRMLLKRCRKKYGLWQKMKEDPRLVMFTQEVLDKYPDYVDGNYKKRNDDKR